MRSFRAVGARCTSIVTLWKVVNRQHECVLQVPEAVAVRLTFYYVPPMGVHERVESPTGLGNGARKLMWPHTQVPEAVAECVEDMYRSWDPRCQMHMHCQLLKSKLIFGSPGAGGGGGVGGGHVQLVGLPADCPLPHGRAHSGAA